MQKHLDLIVVITFVLSFLFIGEHIGHLKQTIVTQEQQLSDLNNSYDKLHHIYTPTHQDLVNLGASSSEADAVISASSVYHIDPKH